MKSAKFHLIGEDSDWYKLRVQKEIEAQGLSGNVLDAGAGKLVVVAEGDEKHINRLYAALKDASPSQVVFSLVEYGRLPEKTRTSEEEKWDQIIELLREVEKTLRRVNQKLDSQVPVASQPSDDYVEDDRTDDDRREDAEDAFAFMFG
ncbi:MAG: hypothetical protein ABH834_02420 [Candidatus Altiarchaeota archaeon]